MEWRKIVNCVVVAFACTAVLLGGCSSSSVNVVTVTVSPSAATVIVGQIQTFARDGSREYDDDGDELAVHVFLYAFSDSLEPEPRGGDGNLHQRGRPFNGGSIGTWVETKTTPNHWQMCTRTPSKNLKTPPVAKVGLARIFHSCFNATKRRLLRSAGFQPAVSPTSSRQTVGKTEVVWNGRALRVGNPRYSRLEVCATAACTRFGAGGAEIAQKALYGHVVNVLLFNHNTFTTNDLSRQTGGMAWPLHGVNWLSFYHNY